MLTVENLSCRRGMRMVLRDVSFALHPGDCLFVTGANGSGKSTLLRAVAGLMPLKRGSIRWQNAILEPEHLHYIGHHDAVKPELTVAEMVAYWRVLGGGDIFCRQEQNLFPSPSREGLGEGAVRNTELGFMPMAPPPNLPLKGGRNNPASADSPFHNQQAFILSTFTLTHLRDTPIRRLSAGQKRRLALTRLLLGDAPLWLLDEPTTALDQPGRHILAEVIAQHRATGGIVIAALHDTLDAPDAKYLTLPPRAA